MVAEVESGADCAVVCQADSEAASQLVREMVRPTVRRVVTAVVAELVCAVVAEVMSAMVAETVTRAVAEMVSGMMTQTLVLFAGGAKGDAAAWPCKRASAPTLWACVRRLLERANSHPLCLQLASVLLRASDGNPSSFAVGAPASASGQVT